MLLYGLLVAACALGGVWLGFYLARLDADAQPRLPQKPVSRVKPGFYLPVVDDDAAAD